MAFTSFANVGDLTARYDIEFRREAFVVPVPGVRVAEFVRSELAFTIANVAYDRSEIAAREALIYPLLRDAWKPFSGELSLFSGEQIRYDDDLRGEVDYVVCRRSPRGPLAPGRPYLFIGEAKRDDATGGWAQAIGGMLAAQKLDGDRHTYFGMATTGWAWRFGKLVGKVFTQDPRPFGIDDIDELAGALHFVFAACRDQLREPAAAPGGE